MLHQFFKWITDATNHENYVIWYILDEIKDLILKSIIILFDIYFIKLYIYSFIQRITKYDYIK